jgi:hypothetical protein
VAFERGRLECITLCADIHRALPQEIRDLVYDQLVRPGLLHHVMEARDEHGNVRVSQNPMVSMSFFDPRSRMPENPGSRRDVWKFSEYTGDVVGKEIAERWYRTATFVIYAEDTLFYRFLTTDVWGKGAIPADVVRSVQLIIPNDFGWKEVERVQVAESLDLLSCLSNKKAHIVIEHQPYFVSNRNEIGRAVCHLRDSGYKKVQVFGRFDGSGRQDLTHLFDTD